MSTENKYVHYCWFGGKPLPNKIKKRMETWRKYLPDYEIIEWNEGNFDVSSCAFSAQAYAQGKWAFVADYARFWVLSRHGGIYLDTDMEILKPLGQILEQGLFIGEETSGWISGGIIGVKHPDSPYIKEMLGLYTAMSGFKREQADNITVPKIITSVLSRYKRQSTEDGTTIIDDVITVYPAEYFYPIDGAHTKKAFTDKTVAVHLYDGSWMGRVAHQKMLLSRILGPKVSGLVLYPNAPAKRLLGKLREQRSRIQRRLFIHFGKHRRSGALCAALERATSDQIVLACVERPAALAQAQEEFGAVVPLYDSSVYRERELGEVADRISHMGKNPIIFFGFEKGWDSIARRLKSEASDQTIRVVFSGDEIGADSNIACAWKLHESGIIDEMVVPVR